MSNSGVLASIQEYVEQPLQRRDEGYTEEGLRGFNWHKAELAGCDLSGLNLRKLDMRGADLSEANLSGTILDWDEIPLVPNLDAAILAVIEAGGQLDMNRWHTCDNTHSWAGWAVVLAGKAGEDLEILIGTNAAASLICTKSGSHGSCVPNWYANDEEALADIKKWA